MVIKVFCFREIVLLNWISIVAKTDDPWPKGDVTLIFGYEKYENIQGQYYKA